MRRRFTRNLTLLLFLFCLDSIAETRTWTSTDGRSFDGTMQSANAREVSVRRQDGRTFILPLNSLSREDQAYTERYLMNLARADGFQSGPFAKKLTGEWVKVTEEELGILFQIYGTSRLKRLEDEIPLFVHLHGAGSRADDVETGKVEIAAKKLAEEFYDDFPCLIVVPTCPPDSNWGEQAESLENLIDTISNSLPIDRARIYLSGYSMGARGIGALIERRPSYYAAALFADGEAKMSWVEPVTTSLWFTFSGERDLAGAKAVAEAFTAAGKIAHFDGFPDHIHNQIHWTLAKTEGVYEWCFSQQSKN